VKSAHMPWAISVADLNSYLTSAGVEPVQRDGLASGLDMAARAALAQSLGESVRRARAIAPPVEQWMAASQALFMNNDGSAAARQREQDFWQSLTHIVNGCYAQILLGDLSEFPFFIELLRRQPAGHLVEMATGVARHYVDPSRELDAPQLLQRAQEWWDSLSGQGAEGREISG
jgi:hypothetical protein